MEGVQLLFTDLALQYDAKESLRRKTGARGLRAILEECMLDIMFDLPTMEHVQECIISEEVITLKNPYSGL